MTDIIEALRHNPEADNFDFKSSLDSMWHSIFSHIGVVLAIVAVCILLVLGYLKLWPPVFEARVVVAANAETDMQRNAFYQTWNIFRREAAQDEVILMTSDPVLRRVITELDLQYEEVYHPFMSQVVHIWGESWIGSNYRKVKYRFFPPAPPPPGLTEEMIEQGKILKDFRSAVQVTPIGEANVALLNVKGPTPRVAEVANKVIEVYLDERRKRYVEEAELARAVLQEETDRAYEELRQVENELEDFFAENSLLLAFEKDRVQLSQWLALEDEIMKLQATEAQLKETIRTLESQLQAEGLALGNMDVTQDNILLLRQQKLQLEIQLNQQRQRFLPDSKEVRSLETQIADLEGIISSQESALGTQESKAQNQFYENVRLRIAQIESDLAGTQAALRSKQALFEEQRPFMAELPYKMNRTNDLQRRQELLEAQYRVLNDKLVQATVSATTAKSAPSAIQVIDSAYPPDKPSWPITKLMFLAALVVGGLLGVFAAIFLDLVFIKVTRQRNGSDARGQPAVLLEKDARFVELLFRA